MLLANSRLRKLHMYKYVIVLLILLTISACQNNSSNQTLSPTSYKEDYSFVQECVEINNASDIKNQSSYLIFDSRIYSSNNEGTVLSLNIGSSETEKLVYGKETNIFKPNIYTISPNRKWYIYFEKKGADETQLYLGQINGPPKPSKYWDKSWGDIAYWLNDDALFIPPKTNLSSAILLNPFTGKWDYLISEFPSPLNISFPYFYYNAIATRAIYVSGDNYILWDSQANKNIWLKQTYQPYIPPVWSIDGTKAALVITEKVANTDNYREKLTIIDINGIEINTINFNSIYAIDDRIEINSLNWSPSGEFLAVIIKINDSITKNNRFALLIIDFSTKQILDLCIPAFSNFIVWSPDNNQIAVNTPLDLEEFKNNGYQISSDNTSAIILDYSNKTAFRIADLPVVGWMR